MEWTAQSIYGLPAAPQPSGTSAPAADPAAVAPNTKTKGGLWSSPALWLVLILAVALGLVTFTVRAGR